MELIATRELRAASRKPATYWWRMAVGAFATIVVGIIHAFDDLKAVSGRQIFAIASGLAAFFCLFEGVRKASAAIAEERAEGTLNLLFLTRLTASEFVFGKFISVALSSLQLTIALAPVLALSVLIGGVSGNEFLRLIIALLNTSLISVIIGIVVSARSRDPVRALAWTWAVLAIIGFSLFALFIPAANPWRSLILSISPVAPLTQISDLTYTPTFWTSIALTLLLSFIGLVHSVSYLRAAKARYDEPTSPAQPKPALQQAFSRADAPRWFQGNPIEWLSLREMRMHSPARRKAFLLVLAATSILFILNFWILAILACIVLVWLTIGSSILFSRARRNRSLELWLTTPLTEREILTGHINALRRVFLAPGAILCLALAFLAAGASFTSLMGIYYVVCFSVLLASTPSIAMWIALKTTSPTRAIIWTFASTLVLPWICLTCPIIVFLLAFETYTSKILKWRLRLLAAANAN